MRPPISLPLQSVRLAAVLALPFCFLSLAASGQTDASQTDPKQAICQASWERCLGTGGGKNWKPIYDRCLKSRTACLGGRAYVPDVPARFSSGPVLRQEVGSRDVARMILEMCGETFAKTTGAQDPVGGGNERVI